MIVDFYHVVTLPGKGQVECYVVCDVRLGATGDGEDPHEVESWEARIINTEEDVTDLLSPPDLDQICERAIEHAVSKADDDDSD